MLKIYDDDYDDAVGFDVQVIHAGESFTSIFGIGCVGTWVMLLVTSMFRTHKIGYKYFGHRIGNTCSRHRIGNKCFGHKGG